MTTADEHARNAAARLEFAQAPRCGRCGTRGTGPHPTEECDLLLEERAAKMAGD